MFSRSQQRWLQLGAMACALSLSAGCRQRSAQQSVAPTYMGASYVHAPATHTDVPPVTVAPSYQDVSIVQQHHQDIPNVPGSIGQESLSTGERITVVTYVHRYPEQVETFPSIFWSGRAYYNVHGNFVFWDPFWDRWAFYWGPPRPLIMAWNIQYPWVAYSWGMGFYGPGWYWGGVNTNGFHSLGVVANTNVAPAPLPPRPSNMSAVPRPNHSIAPRPNRPPVAANPNSPARPNRARLANPNAQARPNHARAANPNSRARANRRVAAVPPSRRVQGVTRSSASNPRGNAIPRPSRVVYESRRRPTYVQSNVRTHHPSRTGTNMRVYHPRRPAAQPAWSPSSNARPNRPQARPNYGSSPRPNYRSPARPNYRSSPRPNYSSPPRPNYRAPSRPNYGSAPRSNHRGSSSHATSRQRVVGPSRRSPR